MRKWGTHGTVATADILNFTLFYRGSRDSRGKTGFTLIYIASECRKGRLPMAGTARVDQARNPCRPGTCLRESPRCEHRWSDSSRSTRAMLRFNHILDVGAFRLRAQSSAGTIRAWQSIGMRGKGETKTDAFHALPCRANVFEQIGLKPCSMTSFYRMRNICRI